MVLRRTQIHRRSQVSRSFVFAHSLPLPSDLVWLYVRAGAFTSADLGGIAGPYFEEVVTGLTLMARNHPLRLDQVVAKHPCNPIS